MRPIPYAISELISKSLQDTIGDEETRILNDWLAESIENQRFYERLKDPERLQAGLDFLNSVHTEKGWQRVQEKLSDKPVRRNVLNKVLLRIAAVFVLGLGILWYLNRDQPLEKADLMAEIPAKSVLLPAESMAHLQLSDGQVVNLRAEEFELNETNGVRITGKDGGLVYHSGGPHFFQSAPAYNVLRVPKKGFYTITLGDGTKVWLNADSKLSYPVQFEEMRRVVQLSGEAYFEVAKDTDRPFYVEINEARIRVLGTRFNVNAYSNRFRTTLLEGRVLVEGPEDTQILAPGQEALYKEQNINIYNADIEKVMAWKNGEFIFRKQTIVQIMDEISRWYDVEIVYQDKDTVKRFNGNISRSLQLHEVLDMLSFLSDYTFELNGEKVQVKTK